MMEFSNKNLVALVTALTILAMSSTACKVRRESPADSDVRAYVSQDVANQAYEIIKGMDYIPWTVARDGCYARALYMAMELAAQDIPSSNIYACRPPTRYLR